MCIKSGTDWRIDTKMILAGVIHHYNWMSSGGTGSQFPLEKRNVVYRNCGMQSTPANQKMQQMLVSTSRKETCGGIYVSASSWQDPPTAPPPLTHCFQMIIMD